jgi:SAM-dependent methyltransferase
MGNAPDSGHWPEIAQRWKQVGPPLRPAQQDLDFCTDTVRDWVRLHGAPRVLLLGVTPELYRLPWPDGTDIVAADRNQAMVERVWPGPKEAVHCTDWLNVALPEASRDIVLCDGGLHLLAYHGEQQRLVRMLHSVLSDRGLCILRLFAPPAKQESPETVLHDLLNNGVPNLNILKLRLGMALMQSAEAGVELGTIWRTLHETAPDLAALAARIGWELEHLMVINTYCASSARYHFVTFDEVSGLFCREPGGFMVSSIRTPSYALGERCPTVVLQRRPR